MSHRGVQSPALLLVVIAVAGCRQPVAEVADLSCGPDPAVEQRLGDAMDRHVSAHYAQDALAAAADYTDDVWFRGDDGMELRTRATMESLYEQSYETTRLVDLEHSFEEVLVCGDAAHAVGHYTETIEVGGQQTSTRYNYMVLWRLQDDGSWKMSRGALIAVPPEA